jgi:hypothetical protein
MARFQARISVQTKDGANVLLRMRNRSAANAKRHADNIAKKASQNTTRVKTGAMKAGFKVREIEVGHGGHFEVYNTQDYFPFHELGTKHISASPMLVPAAESERARFIHAHRNLAN